MTPTQPAIAPEPWWRVSMVWLVISGPALVVLASVASAVIAWHAIDPVLVRSDVQATQAAQTDPKSTMAPALRGRNHAATPDPGADKP